MHRILASGGIGVGVGVDADPLRSFKSVVKSMAGVVSPINLFGMNIFKQYGQLKYLDSGQKQGRELPLEQGHLAAPEISRRV